MPKPHTFPPLYNEALQMHISRLKGWGYLEPNQIRSGTLSWSRNGNPTGRISILVNTIDMTIQLDYTYGDEPRKYEIDIVSVPSNLGKGEVYYFECPKTFKRCRILYSIGGYFFHRDAFNNAMYDSQTISKGNRAMCKLFDSYGKSENKYIETQKKHFKKHYAGKPTKRYLKALKEMRKAEQLERITFY
jgi:hypothetical protein